MIVVDNEGVILFVEDNWGWLGSVSITSAMFVVLTTCKHRHVPFLASTKDITTKRPTWLYRGFTSYGQTEWLRNTLLVKRMSCLVSQSESVGRHAAMTFPEKKICGRSRSCMRKHASTFPRNGAMQKGYNQEKANADVSRLYVLRAN